MTKAPETLAPPRPSTSPGNPPGAQLREPKGWRLWLFRILALSLAPLLMVILEVGLRITGYGYPASFLQPIVYPVEHRDEVWTTNQSFGWRFFPKRLARAPVPFQINAEKADAFRIFVIGGSAARGTPDSAYSFGRMLEAMLQEEAPNTRFEVYNAAMTAINSHVAREIVNDCLPREGDLFIIYLGNNEVVGPYGAGTVFGTDSIGDFTPNLTTIRAAIVLQATRTGQLFANALASTRSGSPTDWRGMEMFLEQRVDADDPRLTAVYDHFRDNLTSMVNAIHGAGAETLLVTVATNLRDQPPFSSSHRPDLPADAKQRWQALYQAGEQAAEAGAFETAVAEWQRAAEIDDHHAELRFRIGRTYLELDDVEQAKAHLIAARDLDTLRFRADSTINQTIRRVAKETSGQSVSLLDAARLFIDGTVTDDGVEIPELPGRQLFYEHVHLNFAGNFALASAIYRHLETRSAPSPRPSLDLAQLADRLAFTPFDDIELEGDILRIVSRPPFVDQLDHQADLERRWRRVRELHSQLTSESWSRAEAMYERRLSAQPNDLETRRRLATHLQARRPAASIPHWRSLVDRLPDHVRWRNALALALADAGQTDEALAELARLQTGDETADDLVNRGTVLEARGDRDAADEAYRRAIVLEPSHALANFNLATSAWRRGNLDQATELYRQLLERDQDFAPAHHSLGRCREQQGDLDAAITSYRAAIEADPGFASAYNSLGLALQQQSDFTAAEEAYRRAFAYRHDYALAYFNLADLLWSRGHNADAAATYQRGLSYSPNNVQARYNRAGALIAAGQDADAIAELEVVILARANDPGALHNLAWILAKSDRQELRNPTRAVELAELAARVTQRQSAEILETLAVAYRAAGRGGEASAVLETALSLARSQRKHALATRLQGRL